MTNANLPLYFEMKLSCVNFCSFQWLTDRFERLAAYIHI